MKTNWATGIVIAIISFISFILYMVITMITNQQYDHDLVTEKYYQQELTYQQNIDAKKNYESLDEKINIHNTENGLKIAFPKSFTPEKIKGKVFLYRPSNKKLDFEIPISITKPYLLVPEKNLLGGRWNIEISFTYQNRTYLTIKEINY